MALDTKAELDFLRQEYEKAVSERQALQDYKTKVVEKEKEKRRTRALNRMTRNYGGTINLAQAKTMRDPTPATPPAGAAATSTTPRAASPGASSPGTIPSAPSVRVDDRRTTRALPTPIKTGHSPAVSSPLASPSTPTSTLASPGSKASASGDKRMTRALPGRELPTPGAPAKPPAAGAKPAATKLDVEAELASLKSEPKKSRQSRAVTSRATSRANQAVVEVSVMAQINSVLSDMAKLQREMEEAETERMEQQAQSEMLVAKVNLAAASKSEADEVVRRVNGGVADVLSAVERLKVALRKVQVRSPEMTEVNSQFSQLDAAAASLDGLLRSRPTASGSGALPGSSGPPPPPPMAGASDDSVSAAKKRTLPRASNTSLLQDIQKGMTLKKMDPKQTRAGRNLATLASLQDTLKAALDQRLEVMMGPDFGESEGDEDDDDGEWDDE